jgi:hypothetical protein
MEITKTKGKFILDENGEAVEETDLLKWAKWFEDSCHPDNTWRRVALTSVGKYTISTVFLAVDYNFTDSRKPILFETMVFNEESRECGENFDIDIERYSTKKEALAGHEKIVEKVKAAVDKK